ncbi:hypothetical protein GQX74_003230 [Glossina fuscipes]|nr:hypothetical protein GQX74_003230 [Glossina fuscipes]
MELLAVFRHCLQLRTTTRTATIALTSTTQLLASRVLFPVNNGTPSMNKGRLPSLAMKKSPLLRNLIVPCLRDILVAGPSKDKSTSTMQSLASRPNDISFERIR